MGVKSQLGLTRFDSVEICLGGKITQKLLKLFDVATVVGVLRLYFLELPGSLVNSEEYETVKIIYSGGR
jgi:hypothetical protein